MPEEYQGNLLAYMHFKEYIEKPKRFHLFFELLNSRHWSKLCFDFCSMTQPRGAGDQSRLAAFISPQHQQLRESHDHYAFIKI